MDPQRNLPFLLISLSIFLLISVSQAKAHLNWDGGCIIQVFQCTKKTVSSTSSGQVENESHQVQVVKGPNRKLLPFLDCGALCARRCGAHSRPNVCTRACGTCCARCRCVPPGTYGNREMCGRCYTDMVTHGNKPKCP